MEQPVPERAMRGTAWTVAIFYLLVVCEFFYMASPFAMYFYSVYSPGLDSLHRVSWSSWLPSFFLPHFADTSSFLVDAAPIVGGVFTAAGMLGFLVGAVQVYSRKLRRRGAAVGGIYRFIRHPQYASLILAGAGMLLLWPRYLMVTFFVTMLFAYYILAWVEERECVAKYGQAYLDYQHRTPKFLPFRIPLPDRLPALPRWWPPRIMVGACLYVAVLLLSFGVAFAMQTYTIRHLFAYYGEGSAYIALNRVDRGALQQLAGIATADPRVRDRLGVLGREKVRFINYVMPWEWAVSEIPMNGAREHHTPVDHERGRFKIVYTRAVLRTDRDVQGPDILRYTIRTTPVLEVWIDAEGRVAHVLDPPDLTFYGDVPVPIY